MTLGGLALAVGILVDDATVEVENINRNFDQGKEIVQAILDGASQIAVPALVSTLSICIVFVPMFFLSGVAKYLFVPLAEAVVFAMLASYLLSRTLVPTMARYLLVARTEDERREASRMSRNPFVRMQEKFEVGFEKFRGTLPPDAGRLDSASQGVYRDFSAGVRAFLRADSIRRARLFPQRGQRRIQTAHARADGHAHRGYGRVFAIASKLKSGSRFRRKNWSRIIDNIGLPYSGINLVIQHVSPDRPRRCRYSSGAVEGSPPDERVRPRIAFEARARFSGSYFLRSAG